MTNELGYTLVNCVTDLIYGPYETFDQARGRADDFAVWEILTSDWSLVDWRQPRETRVEAEAV
jgi:hypothetical protein